MGNTEVSDWMAEWQERERKEKERTENELWPVLTEAGVHMVVVEYSGYGDSGSIEEATLTPDLKEDAATRLMVLAAVEDFVYAHLPSGWEINEGSQGTARFDVSTRTAAFEHFDNEVVAHNNSFTV